MNKIFISLIVALLPSFLGAQVRQAANDRENLTVSKGLGQKIDSLFASLDATNSPGVAVTVIENGKVIATKAYGLASIASEADASPIRQS